MRSFDKSDESDCKDAASLNAEPWMLALLEVNPSYCHWGPYEDYMMAPGRDEGPETNPYKKDSGWASRVLKGTWKEFRPSDGSGWTLDELNECVHFYFKVNRASKRCETCGGDGYHPDAHWISESFYEHSSPFCNETQQQREINTLMRSFGNEGPTTEPLRRGQSPSQELIARYGQAFRAFCERMQTKGHWNDDITQDEAQALVDAGRLIDFTKTFQPGVGWQEKTPPYIPTADEVNAAQSGGGLSGHDCINRCILIEQRLKRFGMPKTCLDCGGDGHVFTEPEAHVGIVIWWLHPRKGCSRGIEIERIERDDLPAVFGLLDEARMRNAERFSRIDKLRELA